MLKPRRPDRHQATLLGNDILKNYSEILSNTRVIFYVRRIGLYLYKYRIYGTICIYILKGIASV